MKKSVSKSKTCNHRVINGTLEISIKRDQYESFKELQSNDAFFSLPEFKLISKRTDYYTASGFDFGRGITVSGMGGEDVWILSCRANEWDTLRNGMNTVVNSFNRK